MRGLFLLCLAVTSTLQFSTGLLQRLPNPKLSEVEWNTYYDREENGPGTYSFGYDVDDAESGNTQFRQEERFPNGTVEGSYGLTEPDGNVRIVYYTADQLGYRVRIENSVHKNQNYPPRPVGQSPVPSWILQNQNINRQAKVSPPVFISNSIENSPSRVPLLSYYKGKFYPLYVNTLASRWMLPGEYYSRQHPSYNEL